MVGFQAMLLKHMSKHCISLHTNLETSQVWTQKAQRPMQMDVVIDGYVVDST